MSKQAGATLAQSGLGLGEYRVLWMLFVYLDFENHLVISQAVIARELGMQRQNVQRAIKRLIEIGTLLEGPKIGQNRSYQLNPEFGWMGSAENHVKALDEHRRKRMKAARITGLVPNPDKDPE